MSIVCVPKKGKPIAARCSTCKHGCKKSSDEVVVICNGFQRMK